MIEEVEVHRILLSLLVLVFSFLVSCGALSSAVPTSTSVRQVATAEAGLPMTDTEQLDGTSTIEGTAIARPTDTVQVNSTIQISATILPQPSDVRFSKELRIIRMRVENASQDQLVIDVSASMSTPDFTFVILQREQDQSITESGQMITQHNVVLEPKISAQTSYKTIFFGFLQSERVTAGTHQITLNATIPDQKSVRMRIVFEVLESR